MQKKHHCSVQTETIIQNLSSVAINIMKLRLKLKLDCWKEILRMTTATDLFLYCYYFKVLAQQVLVIVTNYTGQLKS